MKNLSTKANSLDTNTEPLPEDSGIFNPDTFGTGLLDAEEQKHVEKWFYDIYDQLMKSIDLTMLT
jgi:hypothetical protein